MSSRLTGLAIALCLLAPAFPALAQKTTDTAPAARQSDPESISRAHRFAATLIAQANASSFFDDISDSNIPLVRHGRSGMVCAFDPDHAGNLTIYPSAGGAAPGDDVSCNMLVGDTPYLQTFYATRYVHPGTLQQRFDEAVGDMRDRYGAMTDWSGPDSPPTLTADQAQAMPPVLTRRYLVTENGQRLFTRVSMCKVGDWIVMLRFSTPEGTARDADRWASEIFARVVLSVVAHGGDTV